MNPDQIQTQSDTTEQQTIQQPAVTSPPAIPSARNRKLKIWGIVLLLGPSVLLAATITLYAVIAFVSGGAAQAEDSSELFAEPSTARMLANIILFLLGAISVLTWLPGIIVGAVLLGKSRN